MASCIRVDSVAGLPDLFIMRESVFTSEIVGTLRAYGYFAHKIGDAPITQAVLDVTRFTPGKPCDIFVGAYGKFVAIETKQIKKWKAFGLRDMRPSQIKGLDEVIAARNRAFVFLNVRISPFAGAPRENRLLVFDWAWLRERFAQGSIKAKELKALPFTGARKKRFDLSRFLVELDQPSLSDF